MRFSRIGEPVIVAYSNAQFGQSIQTSLRSLSNDGVIESILNASGSYNSNLDPVLSFGAA